MADRSVRGRFVWHELMTPDVAGAHTFYSKAIGWKTEAWEQDPSYKMFVADSGPLGGSAAAPTGAPHWLTYIATDDVAATLSQAQDLGGRVVKELTGMPNGGTYAVLADPQGAQFGVYASPGDSGPETTPRRGEFSWHELATSDYRAAFDFYSALFGWEEIAEHDMGPMGIYFIFGRNGEQKGGIFNKPPEMKGQPAWLGYVRVKDVNRTVDKVKAARGTLINGPMEVPGGDWIAQFLDPYGAMFAVHALASDVKAAAPAASAAPRVEAEASGGSASMTAAAATSAAQRAKKPAKKKAAKKPAKKAPAKKAAARKAPAKKGKKAKKAKKAGRKSAARTGKTARKAAGKTTRKTAGKTAVKRKTPAGKKAGKKKSSGRKRAAARSAKRPARKAARKKGSARKK